VIAADTSEARASGAAGTDRPWLALCWRVVKHRFTSLYPDATHLVAAHAVDPDALASATERYRLHAIRAVLLEADGRPVEAREEAREALAVKGLERGAGPSPHPRPGHPPDPDAELDARLVAIAG